jgi:hypothetical protein
MYPQNKKSKSQDGMQRILSRYRRVKLIAAYKLKTATFGTTQAAFNATAALYS